MKLIRTALIIFLFFVSYQSNAQLKNPAPAPAKPQKDKQIVVPKFQGKMLVLRTIEYAGQFDPTMTISDGSPDTFSLPLLFIGNLHERDYTTKLAKVMNQLAAQGYKLITSNSGGSGDSNWTMLVTAYIFQRD